MLLVLGEFFLITLLSLLTGLVIERLVLGKNPSESWPGWLQILVGFVCFPALLGWLSLVVPIHPRLLLGFLPLAGVLAYLFRQQVFVFGRKLWAEWQAWNLTSKALLGAVLLVALMKGAANTSFYDEGFYYVPFIKWTQLYGVVPGLGNLHHRLAFNSHYHLWSALFSNVFHPNLPLNDTGEYLLILLTTAVLVEIRRQPTWTLYTLGAVFFTASLILVKYRLTCPEADTALLFICQGLVLLLVRLWHSETNRAVWLTAVGILLAGAVTFKLSAIGISLIIIPLTWGLYREKYSIVRWGLVLGAIGGCWLVRNVILSGYLVFPMSGMPPLVSEWAVPKPIIVDEERLIFLFAKLFRNVDRLSAEQLKEVTLFSHWEYYKWDPQIVWLALGGTLALVLVPLLARGLKGWQAALTYCLWGVLVISFGLWFVKAPGLRFHQGPFLVSLGLLILLRFHRWERRLSLAGAHGVLALVFLWAGLDVTSIKKHSIEPTPWLVGPTYSLFTNSYQTSIYIPEYDWEYLNWTKLPNAAQCWNGPEPCTYRRFDNLVMRRPGDLSSGFRFEGPQPFLDGKPFQAR